MQNAISEAKSSGKNILLEVGGNWCIWCRAMDSFFWSLLARAAVMRKAELNQWIDSATHLIYHAMFVDPPKRGKAK